MHKVISIYEARTNLSKYVRQAQSGKIVYVGAYGQPQAIIAPLPTTSSIHIGVWAHKKQLNAYEYEELIGSDETVNAMFAASLDSEL